MKLSVRRKLNTMKLNSRGCHWLPFGSRSMWLLRVSVAFWNPEIALNSSKKWRFPEMGVSPNHWSKWDFPWQTIIFGVPRFMETSTCHSFGDPWYSYSLFHAWADLSLCSDCSGWAAESVNRSRNLTFQSFKFDSIDLDLVPGISNTNQLLWLFSQKCSG